MSKKCLNCEAEFTVNANTYYRQKYCSRRCTQMFWAHGKVPLKEWTPKPQVVGVKGKDPLNKKSKTLSDTIIKRIKAGKTINEVANEFNISPTTVNRIRRDANVKRERNCLQCKEPIPDTRRSDVKFCDQRCAKRHKLNLPIYDLCPECNAKLPKGQTKYCSAKCREKKYRSLTVAIAPRGTAKKRAVKTTWLPKKASFIGPLLPYKKVNGKSTRNYTIGNRNCEECGTKFQIIQESQNPLHGGSRASKTCCSGSCKIKNDNKKRIQKNNKLNAEKEHIQSCVICGNEFSTLRNIGCWKANKDIQKPRPHPGMKYCSIKCRNKKWVQDSVEKMKKERKDLSDNYIRSLLSHGTKGTRGIWSYELVQAKKADVRLKRTMRNITKGK